MHVELKRELYDGSWEAMEADLKARLEGRPYVFRLAHRIEDDLQRIEALKQCEEELGVDLADYLPEEPPRRPRPIR